MVVEDPARDELQGESLAAHDDRVTGVVATLVAHDNAHVFGEEVGELALSLVAPLGSDHHGRGHVTPPDPETIGPLPRRSSLQAWCAQCSRGVGPARERESSVPAGPHPVAFA